MVVLVYRLEMARLAVRAAAVPVPLVVAEEVLAVPELVGRVVTVEMGLGSVAVVVAAAQERSAAMLRMRMAQTVVLGRLPLFPVRL